jgi:hypothetical protein
MTSSMEAMIVATTPVAASNSFAPGDDPHGRCELLGSFGKLGEP